MRVVLGSVYPFDESSIHGGVEASTDYLVGGLAQCPELELHVVSFSEQVPKSFTEQRGRVTFHWLKAGRRLYGLRALSIDAWRASILYRRIHPQVIHAQAFSEYALGSPKGIPMLLTVHGVEMFTPYRKEMAHFRGGLGAYRRLAARCISRSSLHKASALVSPAGRYGIDCLGGSAAGKLVYPIDNPVSESWFSIPCDQEIRGWILCVGDILQRKNTAGLVRAFALVVGQVPEARLFLAGGAPEPGYHRLVCSEIRRLGLEQQVHWLGHLDQPGLMKAYAQASIVVQASHQETAPVALSQALAAGKPVAATRAGGTGWIVQEGVTGCLVEPGDMPGLAERMVRLLRDPVERQSMARRGRQAARQRFSPSKVADRLVKVYSELAGRNCPSGSIIHIDS